MTETLATAESGPLFLRVAEVRQETDRVRSYTLVGLDGGELPPFTAGSHIGIIMPGRITRYYSICSAPSRRDHYEIAVQREDQGRGGSRLLHSQLTQGRMVKVHRPRNLFSLAPEGHHLLIAGGIGITPMLAMVADLTAKGQTFELIVCVSHAGALPFGARLQALERLGVARVIFTQQHGMPDFAELLGSHASGQHAYVCGSPGFMAAVEAALGSWPRSHVHTESFTPVTALQGDLPFVIEARASGRTLNVAADQSILQALRANGIEIDSVCENGTCGTCRVRYLAGQPEHRDSVLSALDRQSYLMACVSRAKEFLEIDL